jgi:hypothetical protein
MSEDQPAPEPAEQAEQGSVFGKLPDSRPGRRSPRRDGASKPKAAAAAAAKPAPAETRRPARKSRARPAPPVPSRREPASPRRPAAADPAPGQQGGGLDDLAWAGVAALAEAATFGVRLANRAFGALRGDEDDDAR